MKRRRLTPDEQALWKRVTRDVRARRPAAPPTPDAPPTLGEAAPGAMFPTRAAAPASSAPPAPKRKIARPPSPFVAGDPALDRKARRGRLRPERALDLHGLTQAAARTRLEAFLEGAARDGLRCVLVITGKDAGRDSGGGNAPYADKAPRGVLNRRFRDWLAEAPLRALVSRASPAAPADGGSGAFYVFLKARKR